MASYRNIINQYDNYDDTLFLIQHINKHVQDLYNLSLNFDLNNRQLSNLRNIDKSLEILLRDIRSNKSDFDDQNIDLDNDSLYRDLDQLDLEVTRNDLHDPNYFPLELQFNDLNDRYSQTILTSLNDNY